jgi:hypothetical protein
MACKSSSSSSSSSSCSAAAATTHDDAFITDCVCLDNKAQDTLLPSPSAPFPLPHFRALYIAACLLRLSLGPTGRFEQCSGGCCCCYASSSSHTVRSPLPLRTLNVAATSATAARPASSTAATKHAAAALQVPLAAPPPSAKKCNTLPMYLHGLLQLRPSM